MSAFYNSLGEKTELPKFEVTLVDEHGVEHAGCPPEVAIRERRAYSDAVLTRSPDIMDSNNKGFLFPTYGSMHNNSSGERTPLLESSTESVRSGMSTPSSRRHSLSRVNSFSASYQSVEGSEKEHKSKLKRYLGVAKVVILAGVLLFCLVALIFIEEKMDSFVNVAVRNDKPTYLPLPSDFNEFASILKVKSLGAFLPEPYLNFSQYHVWFTVVQRRDNQTDIEINKPWSAPIAPVEFASQAGLNLLQHFFYFTNEELKNRENGDYSLRITTDEKEFVSFTLAVNAFTEVYLNGLLLAGAVLVGLYILLVFELVHRTLAAMIAATIAIAFLALIKDRPTLEVIVSWLDVETLSLLFGMMVLVAILCETGFFDFLAVLAYRVARGRIWPMIFTLCIFTGLVSAFLDNVTTILLMTPVTIRLCEVMNLDPRKILICLVIFSNIGGAATPVGDPPNVIIISNKDVTDAGIEFAGFTAHCFPGIALCMIGALLYIRIVYRDISAWRFEDPPEVVELKHEIEVWRKASRSMPGYSRDESTVRRILKKKVRTLQNMLKKRLYDIKPSEEDYKANLEELRSKYRIHNMKLFVKTAVVLTCVMILFFMHSVPDLNLSLGWIALLGAFMLLILGDFDEMDSIIARVEWPTLIFFAALFVVMEALAELGLLDFIGTLTEDWIRSIPMDQRLTFSILLILWVSAIASSFIDNIPFTTIMVQIVVDLGNNKELGLPLVPIIYSLAFGACLGGNGTLIGASANVVCAGVAEQHGYRFSFMDFFKIGFPIMILTTAISTGYLLLCHVALEWNT